MAKDGVALLAELREVNTANGTVDEISRRSYTLNPALLTMLIGEFDRVTAERDSQAEERQSAENKLAELRLAHRALKEDYETDKRSLEGVLSENLELRARIETLLNDAGSIQTETKLIPTRSVDAAVQELAKDGWTARVVGVAKAAEAGQDPFSAVLAVVCTKVVKKG